MHDSDTAKVYIIRKERRNEFVISLRGNIKMRSFSFFVFSFLFPLADVRRRVSFDAWWVEIRRKNSAHEDATVFLWMKTSPSPKKEIASNIRNKRNCFFFRSETRGRKKKKKKGGGGGGVFRDKRSFFFLVDLVCGWKRNRIDVRMNYWHNSPAGVYLNENFSFGEKRLLLVIWMADQRSTCRLQSVLSKADGGGYQRRIYICI